MTNRPLYFNGLRQYLAGFGGFDPVNSLTGSGPADRTTAQHKTPRIPPEMSVSDTALASEPTRSFQGLILALQRYWADYGCVILQPYDMEVGAGTFHPATTLRALGPKPWNAAYVQPSRRPKDGRYGENPNRLQHYYQFQVILKPSPDDLQDHECIQFLLPRTGQRVPWRLRVDGEERDLQTNGGLVCSEDILGCATLARAGAGLLQTYRFIVEKDISQGTLVEVLKPFGGASRPFSLIYPGSRHMPLRVRALADFLAASLQRGGRDPLKKSDSRPAD